VDVALKNKYREQHNGNFDHKNLRRTQRGVLLA
jgi:hypothetical protein